MYCRAKSSPLIVLALTSVLTFGKQAAGLVDTQRGRSCFWIRLTWILCCTHTHTNGEHVSDTDLQVKCTASHTAETVWCPVHLCAEAFSPSKSSDSLTSLNLSDRNLHTASLNYSPLCCLYCMSCMTDCWGSGKTNHINYMDDTYSNVLFCLGKLFCTNKPHLISRKRIEKLPEVKNFIIIVTMIGLLNLSAIFKNMESYKKY